jgi:hypothetical protein
MNAVATVRVKNLKAGSVRCQGCHRSIREGQTVHVLDGKPMCVFCGDPDESARILDFDRNPVLARIKAALKRRSGKVWSVTGGRGTAWGWLKIASPKARLGCARLHDFDYRTDECKNGCGSRRHGERTGIDAWHCTAHVCTPNCYGGEMTPEDRAELQALLGLDDVHQQGVSIMASHDAYAEYVDRAEGREPRVIGLAYWD